MVGEVPEGWERSTLGCAAEVILGQSPPSALCNDAGIGLPFFQGNAEFGPLHPIAKQWILEEFKVAEPTDVLLSVRAPVGELNITLERCVIGRGLAAIRGKSADPRFIYYLLHERRRLLDSLGQGSTFEAINGTDLRGLPVLLPPLPEQQKIAAILSSVDEAIQATQAVIDQTRRVKEGLLQDLLTRGLPGHTRFKQTEIGEIPEGWEVCQLSKVLSVCTYGFTNPMPTTSAGPWMVTATNIVDGRIDYDNARKTSAEAYEHDLSDKSKPKVGDVLVTKDGTLGRVAVVDQANVCINQSVAVLRPHLLSTRFLMYLLQSPPWQERMLSDAGGSTIKHIYISNLAKMPVVVPPPNDQDNIVLRLDAIVEAGRSQVEEGRALLDLKSGLLADLLTGKVRVTT